MIVSKQLLLAAAAVPILVALVIAIPRLVPAGEQTAGSENLDLRLQFVKEDMKRISFGVTETIGAERSEILIINNDGGALYNVEAEGEKDSQKRFQVSMQQLRVLKAFFAETGFMYLPDEPFDARDDVDEFTRYTLTVSLSGSTKTVQWVDETVSKDFVPPLLLEARDRLLAITGSLT